MATNNRKKKGFTLIEMLVVIAIIAILVSIIIPAISDSTTRAAAAANAANLRAMEGVLTAMRLDNPAAFDNWAETFDRVLGDRLSDGIKWFLNLFGGLGDRLDTYFRTVTATGGQLRLPFDLGGEAIDVPTSVKMSYKISETQAITLEGGTPMSIYISEENGLIVCSYAGYTREDFADIADNGKIDREDFGGSAPGAGGGCLG